MKDAHPVSTQMEKCVLITEVNNTEPTAALFREAVGCLIYLVIATRPDIVFAVNYFSQFLKNSEKGHWKVVKRVFKYIRGTASMGVKPSRRR